MSTFFHDVRFAARLLLKKPLFTTLAVVTLALGIGLNTAVFSAVDALLLRPLPGTRDPDALVQVYRTWPGGMQFGSNSIPHWRDLRERSRDVFSDAAAWTFAALSISTGERPEQVMGEMVSANFFSVLGVDAVRGRVFAPSEDVGELAHPVTVISHAAWQRRFGGAEDIVGRSIRVNGVAYTIIGVTPPEFQGPLPLITPEMWVPLAQLKQVSPGNADAAEQRNENFMNVVARLQPGVTVAQARAQMTTLSGALKADYPDAYAQTGIHLVPQSEAGIHPMFRSAQLGLTGVVMAVVLLLLLVACVNVANLFLSRAQERWREMAVRLSIGARRGVLIRQLLTESLLFAVVAGGVGLLVAWWAIAIANRVTIPMDIDFTPNLRLSVPVLAFSFAISLATGLLFGLAPALQATRPALIPALKGEAPAGGSRSRLSRTLVVAQMALSLVLLTCAGLFLRNLSAATQADKGFVSDGVLMATVDPELQGYSRGRSVEFYDRLLARLRALPGVEAVGMTTSPPLGLASSDRGIRVPGYTPAENEGMSIFYAVVSPGYFEALRIPLTSGRGFELRDDSAATPAIVVNEQFVKRFWPDGNAIGRIVRAGGRDNIVIGVVPTGKYRRLGEPPTAFMYFPQAQEWRGQMTLLVRTSGDPVASVPALRAEVAALDSDLPVSSIQPMSTFLGLALLPARLAGTTLGVFGVLGLLLAAVGMYGVMSYAVAQRTREIGIRMAIGAARGEVVSMVMRQGLAMVAIGGAIGLGLALGTSRLIRGVLYGAGAAFDPLTYVAVPLVLAGVAALATWIPARRAASIDPVVAIRAE
ncbi:MAG: ABC transporter permease [Gemmatimonadota bacterium]